MEIIRIKYEPHHNAMYVGVEQTNMILDLDLMYLINENECLGDEK